MPKSFKNNHYWAILRAQNHCFPAGILHLPHMAPYGPTFVVQICSYDTPYSHIFHWKRRLGIHEGHQIVHFHAYMQPSIFTSRVSNIHSSISLMFLVLVNLMSWRVGGVVKTTSVWERYRTKRHRSWKSDLTLPYLNLRLVYISLILLLPLITPPNIPKPLVKSTECQ